MSFTLPVDPIGLPGSALTLLRSAKSAGVNVSVVNIMAMDYGAQSSSGKKMGDLATSAANATFNQIKGIFTGKTDAQLWFMIGVTPMIGVNDVQSEVFRQSDAQQITDFAKQKGVGLLAYWALQRDRPGNGGLDSYSMVNSRAYEFYQIMAAARGSTPTPSPSGDLTSGRYAIASVHSGKCVDVDAASKADGANVQQYQCNGSGAQQFDVSAIGNGWYKIINVNSGKALDVAGASLANGANVQQWSDNGSGAQRFAIQKGIDPIQFSIKNQNSGKCVDVADWSTNDRGNIQQWDCGNGNNQKFTFTKVGIAPAPAPTPNPAPPPAPTPSPQPSPAPTPGACTVWREGQTYAAGSVVSYSGKTYTALVTHTAYVGANWNPAGTPSLWGTGGACGIAPAPAPTPAPSPAPGPSPAPAPAPSPVGFKHPGILVTQARLDALKAGANAHLRAGYNLVAGDWRGSYNYAHQALSSVEVVGSGSSDAEARFKNDANAAYLNALNWVKNGDVRHRNKSIQILNDWGKTFRAMTVASGTNGAQVQLESAWMLPVWLSAAEIMKHHHNGSAGWSAQDIVVFNGFVNRLYDMAYQARTRTNNWAVSAALAMMSTGVFQDNKARYEEGRKRLMEMMPLSIYGDGEINELQSRDCWHPQYNLIGLVHGAEMAAIQGDHSVWTHKVSTHDPKPRLAMGLDYMANALTKGQGVRDCRNYHLENGYADIGTSAYMDRNVSINAFRALVRGRSADGGSMWFVGWSTATHGRDDY